MMNHRLATEPPTDTFSADVLAWFAAGDALADGPPIDGIYADAPRSPLWLASVAAAVVAAGLLLV